MNAKMGVAGLPALILAMAALGGAPGLADTITTDDVGTPIEEAVVEDGGAGIEEIWIDDGWTGEEWVEEPVTDEAFLYDWDESIAWSGAPLDEELMFYTMGGPGGDWVKRGGEGAPAPVPLPAAGLLLVGGIAAFGLVRRRRS